MSIEKNVFQWIPKTNESTHFVRKFLYLGFIVSVLQYLDSYYNEYPLKQTATLYLQLPLRLLVYFVSFGKISLCLFLCLLVFAYLLISEYLDEIRQWKEVKEAFSVNLQTWNLWFWLRQKIKQDSGSPNKE